MTFDLIPPLDVTAEAERILLEAWPTSGILHTSQYLKWQFKFPGASRYPAAIAFDGSEPVGFVGVTSRQVRFGAIRTNVALVSFVAVRPRWRRMGIAAKLYATLLDKLAAVKATILTFALVNSHAERLLLSSYELAGFQVRQIGTYPTYAYAPRRDGIRGNWEIVRPDQAEMETSASELLDDLGSASFVLNDWNAVQLSHYQTDPRPRATFLLRTPTGGTVAAGHVIRSQWVTPQGVIEGNTLDSLAIRPAHGDALGAVIDYAADCWRGVRPSTSSSIVVAPSLCGIDRVAVRNAGLRQMGTTYRGYIFSLDSESALLQANGTNVEIT